jgi:ankyrin repeat protein
MPPPDLPFDVLILIAPLLTDDDGERCFSDFNSFLQANRSLYNFFNRTLWREAAQSKLATERVFLHLIRTNDLTRLKFFLDLGADVDARLLGFENDVNHPKVHNYRLFNWSGPTALSVVVDSDNVSMARVLLEHGADLAQYGRKDRLTHTALHVARSAEMVKLLLDHHADPEQESWKRLRPLHYYTIQGDIDAMEEILRQGAKVDAIGGIHRVTPLHLCERGNGEVAKVLLKYGADAKTRDHDDNTALHGAALQDNNEVARILVEHWPEGLREKGIYGYIPLHWAAMGANLELVRLFVERWPESKGELDDDGNTPLSVFERQQSEADTTDEIRVLLGGGK